MPQVNTLAIDIAPGKDFSPVQSGALSSSKNSNKEFSQVIEQHYKSQQSGKEQEKSGNKTKLDTDVLPENTNIKEKSSSTGVQSKEKEIGTVSDEEIHTEVQENKETDRLLSTEKGNSEKTGKLENSQKEIVDEKAATLVNVNSHSTTSINIEDSTEQFMSLLSASQKILNDEVESDSTVTPNNNKKLSIENVEHKRQEKTALDVLLKQVKVDKSLTEQVKPPTEVTNEALISKVVSTVHPTIEGDESIKGEGKLDLSVLIDKKSDNEKTSSMQSSDANNQLSNLKNKKNEITNTAFKTENVIDKSINTGTQKISAGDLEAIAVDVENIATDRELEKIKAELSGIQDKVIAPDKSTQNITKVDSALAKNITGKELSLKLQNENVVGKVDASIDTDHLNTDKVAFAGVSVSGEKQAMENTQNQSRVVNQATHKVLEPQSSDTGEQFKEQSKEQSLDQQNQKQAQSLSNAEKLVSNEAQMKEKPFSELFDKKGVSSIIENTLNRDINQVNEATKSAASAEEMITKLTSENAQSTAQSVTNAKQITSLQNEALSVYRKDFTGELKDKVMVMMNQKLQQIEIRLDPQELGNVNVKINLQNDQAVVNFTVQNQQAKEAFDQNLGRLKDMLAESGVDVGDANVEQQNKQSDDEALGDERQGGEDDIAGSELSELSDTQIVNLVKGSSTGVDYYA